MEIDSDIRTAEAMQVLLQNQDHELLWERLETPIYRFHNGPYLCREVHEPLWIFFNTVKSSQNPKFGVYIRHKADITMYRLLSEEENR